jgi:ankyrin repeat protein
MSGTKKPIGGTMNKTYSLFSRFFHTPNPLAAVMLLILSTLVWCNPALCGPIHDAARDGDLQKVKTLLKGNPDLVFSKDNNGNTPLHWAAHGGHRDVAEFLMANKAEVNAQNELGFTSLHLAVQEGYKDVVELLLARKAEVNAEDNYGNTPLHWAAYMRREGVAELLRQHGGLE